MDTARAIALLDELHQAQNEFHAGGESAPLRELLTPDIAWIVPGENHIAGSYHGIDAVFDYFRRRREFANGTFRTHRRGVLVGDGDRLAALTDGTATIGGPAAPLVNDWRLRHGGRETDLGVLAAALRPARVRFHLVGLTYRGARGVHARSICRMSAG